MRTSTVRGPGARPDHPVAASFRGLLRRVGLRCMNQPSPASRIRRTRTPSASELRRGRRALREVARRRPARAPRSVDRGRRRRADLVRGPEVEAGAEAGPQGARARRRPRVRLGRRRHGAALHRRARRHRRHGRHRPGRHREPARDQPRHPEGHRGSRRDRAARRPPPARRRHGQRRALRGDGRRRLRRADDPRRRPAAEGPGRPARLRVDRRQEPRERAGRRPRRRSTASEWFDGQGELRPRRQRRQDHRRHRRLRRRARPTTAGSRSASSPRRAGGSGRGRWRASRSGTREPLAVRRSTTARADRHPRSAKADPVRARRRRPQARPKRLRDQGRARTPITVCVPTRASRREHRDARARDVGADRRRRPRRRCAAPGAAGCCADAFLRLRVADGFSHARSLAFATSLVLVQAIIALVGLGSRARQRQRQPTSIVRAIQAAVPGPAGELLTARRRPGAPRRRRRTATPASCFGLVGALDHRARTLHGPARAGPQPHLRRRAGPPDAAEVRAGAPARRHRRDARGRWRSSRSPSARTIGDSIDNHGREPVWGVVRWPLALVLDDGRAITLLFRWCPRRHQPAWSWLAFGAAVVGRCCGSSSPSASASFFSVSTSFGETYGPLAGIVALLLWALLSSIAVLFGAAVAAQLEAVAAGAPRAAGHREGRALRARQPRRRRARGRGLVTDRARASGRDPHRRRPQRGFGGRSKASSASRPPRATASTSSATATRSSRRCSTRSSDAEHTIDFLTFVYWEGDIGTRVRRAARRAGASRRAGAGAARRVGRATDRTRRSSAMHGRRRRRRCAGSGRCAACASAR